MRSVNPATEELIAEYPDDDPPAVERKLLAARKAFGSWREVDLSRRAELLRAVAGQLRRRVEELSLLMTREMGKPIGGARAEIEKCAAGCDHFAERGTEYLKTRPVRTKEAASEVQFEPLGPVLAIMPWNFPFWQLFRFAAPALMAGNVGLLKHAPNVTGCSRAIESLFNEAGFPAGVFQSLYIDTDATTEAMRHPIVRAVTLTGSERAGRSVGAVAGGELKPTVLELGGSDPFLVLPDADPKKTARAAALARCVNSGQSCIAAKRFIVVGDAKRFEAAFAAELESLRVGDPLDEQTEVGPLARLDLLENLQRQVDDSIAAGARLVTGGGRRPGRGFYFAPTLLADVRAGMPAFDEETFGPVAALIAACNLDEAVELANATRYGLGASIWTADPATARRDIAPRLAAGAVFINGPVKSEPALPFGGIKNSGYGRELSEEGIKAFVNVKTVWATDL